jgi:hypothetical protein
VVGAEVHDFNRRTGIESFEGDDCAATLTDPNVTASAFNSRTAILSRIGVN